jgi:hypothetical protein
MKQLFAIILTCIFAVACSSPNKIPDDIMGIDKMKPIVWDMLRAGALSQNIHKTDSTVLRKETFENYQQVFKVYGITKDDFYKSYNYYLQHPDKNKILIDSVIAYAGRQRAELYKKMN